jgi:hypothetical protein
MGQKAMEPERGVALHELQHAIQRQEGFAKGGSPSTVLNDWYAGVNSELSSLSKQMDALPEYERKFDKSKQSQYDVLRNKYDDLMNQKLYNAPDAEDAYFRLAGEAEARAVQKRMNFSDVQRRVVYPYESYDVKPSNLIIKNTDGISESKIRFPQEEAMRLAQQRAALPEDQGGYGLLANNTAAERAKAMGGKEAIHFSRTGGDFDVLDSGQYAVAPFDAVGTHVGTKEAALDRFRNTSGTIDTPKGSTYPVQILGDKPLLNQNGMPWGEDDLNSFLRKSGGHNWSDTQGGKMTYQDMNKELRKKLFDEQGYTSIPYFNEVEGKGSISYIVPPDNLRSRFAAYDPFRRSAAIAASMGLAAPDLLAEEEKPKKRLNLLD